MQEQLTQAQAERFWAQVEKTPSCWLWTGPLLKQGYGAFSMRGTRIAHRVLWIVTIGPIPPGLKVLHRCDVNYPIGDVTYRRCVRPDHLRLGTQADNIRDAIQKGSLGDRSAQRFIPEPDGYPDARLGPGNLSEDTGRSGPPPASAGVWGQRGHDQPSGTPESLGLGGVDQLQDVEVGEPTELATASSTPSGVVLTVAGDALPEHDLHAGAWTHLTVRAPGLETTFAFRLRADGSGSLVVRRGEIVLHEQEWKATGWLPTEPVVVGDNNWDRPTKWAPILGRPGFALGLDWLGGGSKLERCYECRTKTVLTYYLAEWGVYGPRYTSRGRVCAACARKLVGAPPAEEDKNEHEPQRDQEPVGAFVDRCLEYGSFKGWIVDALRERFGPHTPKVAAEEQVDWGIQRWKQRHSEARIYRATHNGLPPADWKPDDRPGFDPEEHQADEIVAEQERLEAEYDAVGPTCRECGGPLGDADLDVEQAGEDGVWLHRACNERLVAGSLAAGGA